MSQKHYLTRITDCKGSAARNWKFRCPSRLLGFGSHRDNNCISYKLESVYIVIDWACIFDPAQFGLFNRLIEEEFSCEPEITEAIINFFSASSSFVSVLILFF